MRKFLLAALMVLMVAGVASAEGFTLNDFNLQGDTLYLPIEGAFAAGIGYTVAEYKFIEARVEIAAVIDNTGAPDTLFGPALGVKIRDLIEMAGAQWKLPDIFPSIGVAALLDLNGTTKVRPAVYMTILKKQF